MSPGAAPCCPVAHLHDGGGRGGSVTAIYAATIGITQFDIKRVLAYSTVSQLGICSWPVAWGFTSGIFHLMTPRFL